MTSLGILGGGFGLYGYTATALSLDKYSLILLPSKYKRIIHSRNEFDADSKKINYFDVESEIIQGSDELVLARRPAQNLNIIENISHVETLYLEKPIAVNPLKAKTILHKALQCSSKTCICYLLFFCYWFDILEHQLKNDDSFHLTWNFKAHHIVNNLLTWKSDFSQGGGVLSFYGIHFIAIATYLGFTEVLHSFRDLLWQKCSIKLQHTSGKVIIIDIDSNSSEPTFTISSGNRRFFISNSPIVNYHSITNDSRQILIKELLQGMTFKSSLLFQPDLLFATLDLWERIELQMRII
ncbi:hypothetical protein PMIT1342_01866 [Prochlorococcus marinus str. MIT 1342]|uniref:hypothetical protein n=1 Tax=Prochlorococcus TaxID=1218 RepID=UPI0007B3482C|nr:hypothetical protein [Prochlorococcus marinus]KZR79921.1 hypothetical protein PMIT1342_01866 [Prochlorococcus marinus str. MIT 1342]